MKVLIIGNGGREHAIAWKVAQNSKVEKIYCAPGNGGTASEDKCENVAITNIEELKDFAKKNDVDLTIVGPEAPLTEGVVDVFKGEGLAIFGPSKHGAKLEGSKIFAKDFMKKYNVKTAEYASFNDIEAAKDYLKGCAYPLVIKADGLAAGKGVVICSKESEAMEALEQFMIEDIFNGAGKNIVVEEFLEGVEASILSITDGKTIVPFLSAKDHKQIFDGNQGPNTGGMGVISPNPYCTDEVLKQFEEDIMIPTLIGIREEGMDFTGIIFFGVMINNRGVYLLEYNTRMGDPETQAVLPLMKSDFLELIEAAVKGELQNTKVEWSNGSSCCVVAASGGYPGNYKKGHLINIDKEISGKVFCAGVKEVDGSMFTDGGRVLAVTSSAETLEKAIELTYKAIEKVNFDGIYYRKDIGKIY